MRKFWVTLAALGTSLMLVGVAGAGGQARVKLDQIPSRVETGKPFELAITVQPQGWSHTRNIEPIVTAQCGQLKVETKAVALKQANRYRATLNLPAAGEWKIRVDSRYCHTVMTPVSIQALAGAVARKGKSQG